VRYLKDTSGDAVALTELLQCHGDRITTFNGWDTLTFYGIAAGAKGSVWGATNFIPELSRQLWDALAMDADLARGRELWAKIYPICRLLEQHDYSAAVKTGLELTGYPAGPARKPFALLEGDARAELARLLRAAGVEVAS
jgi:dihydrodipicolinate synthase/N-acetylneuraminate lyase